MQYIDLFRLTVILLFKEIFFALVLSELQLPGRMTQHFHSIVITHNTCIYEVRAVLVGWVCTQGIEYITWDLTDVII